MKVIQLNLESVKQYIIRLDAGDEVVSSLAKFVGENKIPSGSIMGLGAVQDVEIGWFIPTTKDYRKKNVTEVVELVGLTGTVAWMNDKPALHMHTVIGDDYGRTYAGHLFSAKVAVTCEFIIISGNILISKKKNQEFGLNFLDL